MYAIRSYYGIETGSPEVAKKIMPAKAHPFRAEEWHDVVCEGMGLMHDNRIVITSYSIHYTKLYDTNKLRLLLYLY